jgi:hypothetical protein
MDARVLLDAPAEAGSRDARRIRDAGRDVAREAAHDAREDAPAENDASDAAPVPDAGMTKYDQNGGVTYATTQISVTAGSDTFTENVYIPSTPGPHPLVSFSPGLQQPAAAYTPYVERLASWGFVVLIRDDPGVLVTTTTVADDLTYVIATWLGAQNATSSSPLFGKVDLTKVGLAGHSRGGQGTLLAIEGGLAGKVVAWFGVDPVDASALPGQPTAGPTVGMIRIPTGFVGAQVSTQCSPADANYEILYSEVPSPSVAVTAVDASHTQFEDPASCVACGLCTPMGTANSAVVLGYSVRFLTAFFARELMGDASVGAAFQGAGGPGDIAAGLVTILSK